MLVAAASNLGRLVVAAGQLIKRPTAAALATEQASPQAATSTFARNPVGPEMSPGLEPGRLAQILRWSIEGDPEAYLALAEEMEERFAHYAAVISIRKRQVARLPVTVDAASSDPLDQAEAELVRRVVESAPFRLAKIDMLDAIGKGFSAVEMIWDTSATVWAPTRFLWRDPRFFVFDPADLETIRLRATGEPQRLKDFGWIIHRAKAKSGLSIRAGLARQVAPLFLFQSFNNKDWAIFAEAFGMPYRLGKYGAGASESDKAALMRALVSMGVDGAGIVPSGSEIDLLEPRGVAGSTDLYERRAEYINRQVSKIVLGQTGTTEALAGGGYALGKVHDDVRGDIRDADAEQLAATVSDQLVPPLVQFNFPDRERPRGLPVVRIAYRDADDISAYVDRIVRLVPLGLQVDMAEVQKRVGVTPPRPGATLLRAPPSSEASIAAAAMHLAEMEAIASSGWAPVDESKSR